MHLIYIYSYRVLKISSLEDMAHKVLNGNPAIASGAMSETKFEDWIKVLRRVRRPPIKKEAAREEDRV
jgi:hypothetical protein